MRIFAKNGDINFQRIPTTAKNNKCMASCFCFNINYCLEKNLIIITCVTISHATFQMTNKKCRKFSMHNEKNKPLILDFENFLEIVNLYCCMYCKNSINIKQAERKESNFIKLKLHTVHIHIAETKLT